MIDGIDAKSLKVFITPQFIEDVIYAKYLVFGIV